MAQRLVALTVAAAALLNYPFLFLAGGHGRVLGVPSLFFYLFAVWAAVIVLVAVLSARERARRPPPGGESGRGAAGGGDA
jgi:hypothetical protein